MVLCHHALPHFNAMGLSNFIFESIAQFSYIGVDIFFVISGFVMAKTTFSQKLNSQNGYVFLGKRLSRIYLGYWPIFLMTILLFIIYQPETLAEKELVQSFFLVNANMFDLVISPSWSLTYELYFYLIVALSFFLSYFHVKKILLVLLCLVVIKEYSLTLGTYKFIDFFLSSFLFEFATGYFICSFWQAISDKKFIPIALIMMILSLSIGVHLNIGYGYIRVLTFGVFASSLVWFFLLIEQHKIFTIRGVLKKTGDFSYTLYLTHTIFLALFYWIGFRDFFVQQNIPLLGFTIMLLLILVWSWLIYMLVEKPLYELTKKKIIKTTNVSVAASHR